MNSKIKLLIVDKMADLVELITYAIKQSGLDLEVVSRRSAEDAFKAVWEENASIVLTSTMIPYRKDYDNMVESIRGAQLGTVIVTMTGGPTNLPGMSGTAEEELGSDFVIAKPFLPEKLISTLRDAMGRVLQTA